MAGVDEKTEIPATKRLPIDKDELRNWLYDNIGIREVGLTESMVEEILDEAAKELPAEYKIEFYDIAVLHSEHDKEAVNVFVDNIYKNILLDDDPEFPEIFIAERKTGGIGAAPFLKIMGEVIERSVYLFIFLTENLCNDGLVEIATHEAIVRHVADVETRWSIVPCYLGSEHSFKVPFGLQCLKGVSIDQRDELIYSNLKALILHRRQLFHKRQRALRERAQDWYRQRVVHAINEHFQAAPLLDFTAPLEDGQQSTEHTEASPQPDKAFMQ